MRRHVRRGPVGSSERQRSSSCVVPLLPKTNDLDGFPPRDSTRHIRRYCGEGYNHVDVSRFSLSPLFRRRRSWSARSLPCTSALRRGVMGASEIIFTLSAQTRTTWRGGLERKAAVFVLCPLAPREDKRSRFLPCLPLQRRQSPSALRPTAKILAHSLFPPPPLWHQR